MKISGRARSNIQYNQSEMDMIDVNNRLLNFLDGHLDIQWENTLMTVFNGYALYKKVTAWNSGSSFGGSLNHYPGCQHLQGPAKKQLTKMISLIHNVYENYIGKVYQFICHSFPCHCSCFWTLPGGKTLPEGWEV